MTEDADSKNMERLIAYLDGELSPEQRGQVEALLERDAEARQLLADMRRNDEMIALAQTADVPEDYWESFNERLMGRILRREARQKAHRARRPAGRTFRWAAPLQAAAAILIAATAAFSIGLHFGGRQTVTAPPPREVADGRVHSQGDDGSQNENDGRLAKGQGDGWTNNAPIGTRIFRTVQVKDGTQLQEVPLLGGPQLDAVLTATEDALTPLANGNLSRPDEMRAYQVIIVSTDLVEKLKQARETGTGEPQVLYVLNNAYDVLNRAATAPPEKATLVAKALQQEVNDRGLLEATQELIRNNREQFRFSQQAPNAPAGDAK